MSQLSPVLSTGAPHFSYVVAGVGDGECGFEALRQALVIGGRDGFVSAVTVSDDMAGVHAGFAAARSVAAVRSTARDVRDQASQMLAEYPAGDARLIHGVPSRALLAVARSELADLLVIGGRHRSRVAGMLLAGTMTTVLRDAPCSVLLARARSGELWHPRRIVVGLDGSLYSLAALAAADELAERLGSTVSTVAALGGKLISKNGQWTSRVDEWTDATPVAALENASADAELVVIGSRGRHGIRSLGSVGERVAHRAYCSVLLVRGPDARVATNRPFSLIRGRTRRGMGSDLHAMEAPSN